MTDRLVKRLLALGLVAFPPLGPYGTTPYSRHPRSGYDTRVTARQRKAAADEWALALSPVITALEQQEFSGHAAVAAELNRRRIAPQRASEWSESSVKNLRNRLKGLRGR